MVKPSNGLTEVPCAAALFVPLLVFAALVPALSAQPPALSQVQLVSAELQLNSSGALVSQATFEASTMFAVVLMLPEHQ